MNKMTKFVLSPYYWIKALDSIEQGNDLDAYYFLNNMHRTFTEKNYKYFLLKSFVCIMLKEYEQSIQSVQQALQILGLHKNKLNESEVNYLTKYGYGLMKNAYEVTGHLDEANQAEKVIRSLSFEINDVRKRIKNLFPQP